MRRWVVVVVLAAAPLGIVGWLLRASVERNRCSEAALAWLDACGNKGIPSSLEFFSVESIAKNAGLSAEAVREKIQAGCLVARIGSDNRPPDKLHVESHQCAKDSIICAWAETNPDDAMAFVCDSGRITRMSLLEGNRHLLLSECRRCTWPSL